MANPSKVLHVIPGNTVCNLAAAAASNGVTGHNLNARLVVGARLVAVACCLPLLVVQAARGVDPYAGVDPFWILIHEPAVWDELKLTAAQRTAVRQLTDELDLRFFPLRNKPAEQATAGLAKLIDEAQQQLPQQLKPQQTQRLMQILYWRLGTAALNRDDVAERLKFSDEQRASIQEISRQTQKAVAALEKEASEGKPREPLEKKFTELKTDEQQQILQLLKPEQRTGWTELLGDAFDLAKLGQPEFKTPELVDTKEWINARSPLRLEQLRGKVVIVHFYASGCINCIHNYPSYRQWYDDFRDQDVVQIGIHTPETQAERDVAGVRRKAAAEKLKFPILIDGRSENWNAWGNSMWPSVYVIDKRGYLRNFWPGELKWQGSDGEKFLRERIELLLAEE
jgi:peroxiredoxin